MFKFFKPQYLFTVCFVSLALVGCADPDTFQDTGRKDRVARMTPQERAALAPNELFMAVLDSDVTKVKDLSESSPQLMDARNEKDGNTALGLAIELREIEIANWLLKKTSLSSFLEGNLRGESYVFLASRAGESSMIQAIANAYYQSRGLLQGYDFGDLDFLNNSGQRALHVAKDRRVIQSLETEYYRGIADFPFWKFTMLEDSNHQTFLHAAVKDLRMDVVRWGVENLCGLNSWEKGGGVIYGNAGYLWTRVRRGFQTYIGGMGLGLGQRFNVQDADGKTPIHLAAEKRNLEIVQAVSSCEWIDFYLADNAGNLPLQSFLSTLDSHRVQFSEEDYKIFNFLLQKRSQMRAWLNSQSDYVDSQNLAGESSLHMAAGLSDPYFYEKLSEIGNVELQDQKGRRPFEIREMKKRLTGQNGH